MRFLIDFFLKNFYAWVMAGLVVYIFSGLAFCQLLSADACNYLNIAQNIAHHKGFVISYNSAQIFNTLYYPIWPYYQFLYPLFCSLFIAHGGIIGVIKVNVVLFAVNAAIIFYVIQKLIPTRLNILFLLYLVFSTNVYLSAIYPWTEQLHFLCFILTFMAFLKYAHNQKALVLLGFLNSVLLLLRESHSFIILGYLLFILMGGLPIQGRIKSLVSFITGVLLFYVPYQWWCYGSTHAFYPQNAKGSIIFSMSGYTNRVIYDISKVGPQLTLSPFFTIEHMINIKKHISDILHQMSAFMIPCFFYYLLPEQKRKDGGLVGLAFCQSLTGILGFSLSFYMFDYFDAIRYSMVHFILISIAGWYCLYQGLAISASRVWRTIMVIVLVVLVLPLSIQFFDNREALLRNPRWVSLPYEKDLFAAYQWIDNNLPPEALIASDERQEAYLMHRPFVNVPEGKAFTCENLSRFQKIYAPDYYLLSDKILGTCLEPANYSVIFVNHHLRLLKSKTS
ncbi:MAG: hypothetical protein HQL13_00405 [Candidatus Omnitrophica bacterium]|nr:hypothetical protein [Candidatus Omnitrophota bacterium]